MQLSLPLTYDQHSLLTDLQTLTGTDIRLVITDNSSSMISVRKEHGHISLRLHRIFLKAGPAVIGELSRFIKDMRIRTPLIRSFIIEHADSLPARPPKKQLLNMRGKYHDLGPVARLVNNKYFNGEISSGITWGSRKTGHAVRRRVLGSYNSRTDTIRINPVLDRKDVPGYYLEFIIYHEMLHAEMGVGRKNGRREVHSREFRRKERLFLDYQKAIVWEQGDSRSCRHS